MLRRRPAELNINHERWLVSYADFVTLLFAFFVVMYSVSQVNESKYRVLSSTLTEIFSSPESSLEPIQIGDPIRSTDTQAIELNNKKENMSNDEGVFNKTADLPQLRDQFSEKFSDLIDDKTLQVNSNEYWLQISLNNSILFPLASVQPSDQAEIIFEEISGLLRDLNNPIQVEGFTDNTAINTAQFPSNWELSAARASAVVKLLVNSGVSPKNLSAVGYGEFQPIAENNTAEGRAQNRRVVLMISREKMDRPRLGLSSADDVVNSTLKDDVTVTDLSTQQTEQTQVNPQPGLAQKDPLDETEKQATIEEKIDRLINANPDKGLDIILAPRDEENDGGESDNPPGTVDENGNIQPVELGNGELLFSSDPDLPRKER